MGAISLPASFLGRAVLEFFHCDTPGRTSSITDSPQMKDDGEQEKLPHDASRRIVLLTRVSEEEEALIRSAAFAVGGDLTDWIRRALVSTAKRQIEENG
jgi:hypothetical protein